MVYWFNGFLYVFRNNPHVSKHTTSHLQPMKYIGLYNMMFVMHPFIKESAGKAGGGIPLYPFIYIYISIQLQIIGYIHIVVLFYTSSAT